jgi:hypothetical protein
MSIGPPLWVERYLGIPGIKEGRGFDGCHCYGLVQLVYWEQLEIILPDATGITGDLGPDAVDAINAGLDSPTWRKVEGPVQAFDGVLMLEPTKHGVLPVHIGVAVGPTHVLHVRPGGVAVCQSMRSLTDSIAGVYRHVACEGLHRPS